MRICIPTESEAGMAAKPFAHFGSAPFFTVVDLDSNEVKVQANPACHSQPGACHHVGLLQGQRVDAVVASGLGRNAFHALQQAGIEVLAAAGDAVADVVAAVRSGKATPMQFAATCSGHQGHGCGGHGHAHPHGHEHGPDHGHQHRHRGGASPEWSL